MNPSTLADAIASLPLDTILVRASLTHVFGANESYGMLAVYLADVAIQAMAFEALNQ